MNKPVKISIVFVCLLVIAGGIYFWQSYKTDELNRQNEVLFSQKLAQAYQVKEQPEGSRVIATVGGEQITYGDLVVEATRGEVRALAEGVTVPFSERVQSAFNTLGSRALLYLVFSRQGINPSQAEVDQTLGMQYSAMAKNDQYPATKVIAIQAQQHMALDEKTNRWQFVTQTGSTKMANSLIEGQPKGTNPAALVSGKMPEILSQAKKDFPIEILDNSLGLKVMF